MKVEVKKLNRLLKSLANERRIKILSILLQEGETTVGDLSQKINLSFKSTSKHLNLLEKVGLLDRRTGGSYAFYAIDKERRNLIKFILSLH